jgi:hypothetical protein
MRYQLKQIGPRIRAEVADALREHSRDTRMSISLLVENAVIEMMSAAGREVEYDHDRH